MLITNIGDFIIGAVFFLHMLGRIRFCVFFLDPRFARQTLLILLFSITVSIFSYRYFVLFPDTRYEGLIAILSLSFLDPARLLGSVFGHEHNLARLRVHNAFF